MELTVDELASRAGVTVRTVRFYAGRGLLPPPRLRGRTGLYGADHLARLELVRELQSLGLTLASIEKHLKRIPPDAPAEDLALQRALLSPWAPERTEDLFRHELDQRAGRHIDDELLKRLEALGVIEFVAGGAEPAAGDIKSTAGGVKSTTDDAGSTTDDAGSAAGDTGPAAAGGVVRVVSPALLGISAELAALPMPLDTLIASHEAVDRHTTALAAELQRVFQDSVVRPYREGGRAPQERERLMEMAGRMKPLMIQSLVTSFQRAVDKAIRQSVPD